MTESEAATTSHWLYGEMSERVLDEVLSGKQDLVELAQTLISTPPRPFRPLSFGDDRTDPYDLDGLDDYGLEDVRRGAMLVLADGYVSEAEWGEDLDAGNDRVDDYQRYLGSLAERLSAHYGDPIEDAEELRGSDEGKAVYWRVEDWTVAVQSYVTYGDGDIELHLWLAAFVDEPQPAV